MTIVAERQFEVLEGAKRRDARVVIYSPVKVSEEEWTCEYKLEGFSKDVARKAHGVDSYQALHLALKLIATDIAMADEYKRGVLKLFDEIGFDIEETMGFGPA